MKGARVSSTFRIHCVVSPVLVGGVGVLREVSPAARGWVAEKGAGWLTSVLVSLVERVGGAALISL